MKRLLICLLALPCGAAAQISAVKARLAQPGDNRARIVIAEDPAAARAVRSGEVQAKSVASGYRVRIFFDNSQTARQKAMETLARFKAAYPSTSAYMSYENPYFKVTVGNCITAEEAVALCGAISGEFDKAFIVREEIPLSAFKE
ncbi:MAG: SPOR domain-containing protein [Rikenellaceae bacterium]|jgi:hypothetical protein|nr:SPOR domain-containing protein [Rikenellaceae bacterium]